VLHTGDFQMVKCSIDWDSGLGIQPVCHSQKLNYVSNPVSILGMVMPPLIGVKILYQV
jgi:hypothetical protein